MATASKMGIVKCLYPYQSDVLDALDNARDCMVFAPTGSGKSMCYLHHVSAGSVVLVICPLVALMRDQVQKAQALGLSAAQISFTQSQFERQQVQNQLLAGELGLLFITPERLLSSSFVNLMSRVRLKLIAVDEAHCISQWGYSFRPEYRRLGELIDKLSDCPRMALTATATKNVAQDIRLQLRLRDPHVVRMPIANENLTLQTKRVDSVQDQYQEIMSSIKSSSEALVYVSTKKIGYQLQQKLSESAMSAEFYHGGLSAFRRKELEAKFFEGSLKTLIATSALSMGVHKSRLPLVIHGCLPLSLERYVQEIGRAGRDGRQACASIYYTTRDIEMNHYMLQRSYPDYDCLMNVYKESVASLAQEGDIEALELIQTNMTRLKYKKSIVKNCLQVLVRERFLTQSQQGATHMPIDQGYFMHQDQPDKEDFFWNEYPARRKRELDKYNDFLEYLSLEPNKYAGYLNDYFSGGVQ